MLSGGDTYRAMCHAVLQLALPRLQEGKRRTPHVNISWQTSLVRLLSNLVVTWGCIRGNKGQYIAFSSQFSPRSHPGDARAPAPSFRSRGPSFISLSLSISRRIPYRNALFIGHGDSSRLYQTTMSRKQGFRGGDNYATGSRAPSSLHLPLPRTGRAYRGTYSGTRPPVSSTGEI